MNEQGETLEGRTLEAQVTEPKDAPGDQSLTEVLRGDPDHVGTQAVHGVWRRCGRAVSRFGAYCNSPGVRDNIFVSLLVGGIALTSLGTLLVSDWLDSSRLTRTAESNRQIAIYSQRQRAMDEFATAIPQNIVLLSEIHGYNVRLNTDAVARAIAESARRDGADASGSAPANGADSDDTADSGSGGEARAQGLQAKAPLEPARLAALHDAFTDATRTWSIECQHYASVCFTARATFEMIEGSDARSAAASARVTAYSRSIASLFDLYNEIAFVIGAEPQSVLSEGTSVLDRLERILAADETEFDRLWAIGAAASAGNRARAPATAAERAAAVAGLVYGPDLARPAADILHPLRRELDAMARYVEDKEPTGIDAALLADADYLVYIVEGAILDAINARYEVVLESMTRLAGVRVLSDG